MSNTGSHHSFEPLTIPRKEISPSANRYRVYTDAANFTVHEATSALEALQKSGLQQAYRIERDNVLDANLIDLKKIEVAPPPVAAPAQSAPATETAAQAASPPAAQAAPAEASKVEKTEATPEKALSSEEVDKLLKGDAPKTAS